MERDANRMRQGRPWLFTRLRHGEGVDRIVSFLAAEGGLQAA